MHARLLLHRSLWPHAQREFRTVRPAPSTTPPEASHELAVGSTLVVLLFLLLCACCGVAGAAGRSADQPRERPASSRTRTNLKAVPRIRSSTHTAATSLVSAVVTPCEDTHRIRRWKQDAHERRRRRRRPQTSSSRGVGLGAVCSLWHACCCSPRWHRGRCRACRNGSTRSSDMHTTAIHCRRPPRTIRPRPGRQRAAFGFLCDASGSTRWRRIHSVSGTTAGCGCIMALRRFARTSRRRRIGLVLD